MILRNFQEQGREFLRDRKYALLLDDAGLGKSATVLAAADDLSLPRVLCVGPAVAGVSWPIELAKWSPQRRGPAQFQFVSYDLLSVTENKALRKSLRECPPWDLLILDEGQYLKTPGANRTKAIYGWDGTAAKGLSIAGNAERVWVLSGTLTPNHAGESFSHLRALFPDVLINLKTPDQLAFEDKFCRVRDTVFGRVITGSKNQGELRAQVQPIMLRRRKLDVLPELKPMEFFTAPIDVSARDTDIFLRDIETPQWYPGNQNIIQYVKGEQVVLPIQDYARQQLGVLKAPACVEWVRDRLGAGEPKIIVFAHHRDVLRILYEGLLDYSPVLIHGDTPDGERTRSVAQFQQDPAVRVFIGQLQAAGTAITLTAASCVFFAEYASTPGVNYQAASRAHRMGQHDAVQVYFGSVPGSLDEHIARTAARKAREIAELFD